MTRALLLASTLAACAGWAAEPDAGAPTLSSAEGAWSLTWSCEEQCVFDSPLRYKDQLRVQPTYVEWVASRCDPVPECVWRVPARSDGTCVEIDAFRWPEVAVEPTSLCVVGQELRGQVRWTHEVRHPDEHAIWTMTGARWPVDGGIR